MVLSIYYTTQAMLRTTATRVVRAVRLNSSAAAAAAPAAAKPHRHEKPKDIAAKRTTGPKREHHYKLKLITRHVDDTVKLTAEFSEAIDILDEGATYLREIEQAENIPAGDIYYKFQPVIERLLARAAAGEVNMGSKLIVDVVDVLARTRLANKYHFTQAASHLLQADPEHGPEQVLQLWVKWLECKPEREPYVKVAGKYHPQMLDALVYMLLVTVCRAQGAEFNAEDAKKLLQVAQLPEVNQVRTTLRNLGLESLLKPTFDQFQRQMHDAEHQTQDPNGRAIYKRLRDAVERKNLGGVIATFNLVKAAAERQQVPVAEATLVRIMDAFYGLDEPAQVIGIFQQLLLLEQNPLDAAWMLFLTALALPLYVKQHGNRGYQQFDAAAQVYMLGEYPVGPKLLLILASGYANYGKFDAAHELVATYQKKGVPLIHPAKNNLVYALVLNGRVTEAEAQLRVYIDQDPAFVPLTTLMNALMSHYAKLGNFKAVEQILNYMDTKGTPYDVATYTIVIDNYCKQQHARGLLADIDAILGLVKGVRINDAFYTLIVSGLVNDGNLEAARQVFAKAFQKYATSQEMITAMIKGELQANNMEEAGRLFRYLTAKVADTPRLWNVIINGCLPKHPELAVDYYRQMKASKLKPNQYTWYFMLKHFTQTADKQVVQELIDDMAQATRAQLGTQLPRVLAGLQGDYELSDQLRVELGKPE